MKNKSLKLFDKLVMAILGLFPFFTACEVTYDYGAPTADFLIKGTVTDELTNTPIKNIRMVIRDSRDSMFVLADTVYTDSNGQYAINNREMPDEGIIYDVKAEDIDGTANGGSYMTAENTANFSEATWDKSKADSWYIGKATVIKDFNLRK